MSMPFHNASGRIQPGKGLKRWMAATVQPLIAACHPPRKPIMNPTPLNVRLAAAFASMVIALSLLSGVTRLADEPVPSTQLAQAATTVAVR